MQQHAESIGYRETEVQIRIHEIPQGNIASYNEALLACRGDVIHLMASDDRLLSTNVYEKCVSELEDPEVSFCSVGLTHMDEQGRLKDPVVLPPFHGPVTALVILQEMQARGNFINGGGTLIRRSAQQDAGPYDPALPKAADHMNWIKVLRQGKKAAFVAEPLYGYRQHRTQMTYSSGASLDERQACAQALHDALERVYEKTP
ncbi:MAG: glycosyltransferase family protein [Planctomycetota bacterium]|jgi:cellulose synthase/poly-beta-1,6-N-acetylglucosamine synthase-like glycosyltransferase